MRRKIAKRIRRYLLRRGVVFKEEQFIKEPGWKRKDCGVCIRADYKGWHITSVADDWLEAYRFIRDDIPWMDENKREETNGN